MNQLLNVTFLVRPHLMERYSLSPPPHPNPPATDLCSFLFCLAAPGGMWDLSSPTRDRTQAPLQWKCKVLTTGPPRKSPNSVLHSQYLPPYNTTDLFVLSPMLAFTCLSHHKNRIFSCFVPWSISSAWNHAQHTIGVNKHLMNEWINARSVRGHPWLLGMCKHKHVESSPIRRRPCTFKAVLIMMYVCDDSDVKGTA